ncbi:unnamed protein product, partial [Ilex paraguariensis]
FMKQAMEICQQLEFEFQKPRQRNFDMEMKEPPDHELRDKIKLGLESQPKKPKSKMESTMNQIEGGAKVREDA